ncbi:MAG: DUF5618 family protein [Prevotellaceae bacterium]|jgi:hypothetical protein|nr:DUF5618 family protein [Prevotellaceae bacterium]
MAELKHPIKEAERYLDNAKQILSEKAGKEGNYYSDPKYVKMAGNTAWNGVLVALDGVLNIHDNLKSKQRADFKDYQAAISQRDKKMMKPLLYAYESLHKVLGYDGNLRYIYVQDGLKQGQEIISWAAKHYKEKV